MIFRNLSIFIQNLFPANVPVFSFFEIPKWLVVSTPEKQTLVSRDDPAMG
jgi:hypothetical protein